MREKLVIAAATGALTLTGLGLAGPALAAGDDGGDTSSSRVERIADALSGLVEDGSITQEQADEVAATLDEADLGGPGGHGRGPDLATAAEALGMSEEELRTALEADGATLAAVAEEQGVAVDTLVQALVAAEEERIAEAVTDGRLTREEADERLADLEQRVTERVEVDPDGRGPGAGPAAVTVPAVRRTAPPITSAGPAGRRCCAGCRVTVPAPAGRTRPRARRPRGPAAPPRRAVPAGSPSRTGGAGRRRPARRAPP